MNKGIDPAGQIGQDEKPVLSTGEEFISWAETYWRLGEIFENGTKSTNGSEGCSYAIAKPIFIKKINEIINQRVKNYL